MAKHTTCDELLKLAKNHDWWKEPADPFNQGYHNFEYHGGDSSAVFEYGHDQTGHDRTTVDFTNKILICDGIGTKRIYGHTWSNGVYIGHQRSVTLFPDVVADQCPRCLRNHCMEAWMRVRDRINHY